MAKNDRDKTDPATPPATTEDPTDPPVILGPPGTADLPPSPDDTVQDPNETAPGEGTPKPVLQTGTLSDLHEHAPVTVKNHGDRDWIGSDYAPVGKGSVPAGGTGVVTKKKALEMVEAHGGPGGMGDGRGPFSIEPGRVE